MAAVNLMKGFANPLIIAAFIGRGTRTLSYWAFQAHFHCT